MRLLTTALALAATTAIAKDPLFDMPLDCTLGQDCYINDYFDRDGTEGAVLDYACNDVTRDNHRGVDFALLNMAQLWDGVDVVAAAPGTVRGVRDELPDIANTDPNAPNTAGRECGNGVAIDHGGGWVTQYCHLRQNTIEVQPGQRVAMGTVLAQVGLSGATNYPHLHFTTFKDSQRVDPFNPDMQAQCALTPADDLWLTDIPYQPGGFVRIGLAGSPPEFSDVRNDLPATPVIPADAPALVAWAHGYTVKVDDVVQTDITGPNGPFWSGE
ncbi:MAG: M23 family metallopeptidase, partial [Pseudomonadota bacterium]